MYGEQGLRGFYRGLTASYMGISETVLNFVVYEKLKERILVHGRTVDTENDRSPMDFAEFMIAGAISKTIACISFYPHGEFTQLPLNFLQDASFINIPYTKFKKFDQV